MKNKIMAAIMCMTVVFNTVNFQNVYAGENPTKKEYLVLTRTNNAQKSLENQIILRKGEYTKSSDKKHINLVKITEKEADLMEKDKDVISVEENITLKGNKGNANKIDPDEINSKWNLKMINGENVSKAVKGEKVKIAVLDSGVDEREGIEVANRINLISEEQNIIPCFDDTTGHGTSIAGIISAKKEGDNKITGVNPNAEIYSIKILEGDNTSPLSRVVEGIYRAIEQDVDIINMSFGTLIDSPILHKAIQDAYKKGILLVASAGNRGTQDGAVEYPAAYDEVLSVASVNAGGKLSESSSSGRKIDIVAPGEYIKVVTSLGLETVFSGTSMAAAHIAGTASVLWQKDRTKTADFIKELMLKTSKKIEDNGETYLLVDLKYALENYEKFEKEYTDNTCNIEENTSEIQISEDAERVTARWSKNNHEALVKNNKNGKLTTAEVKLIRAGIRYNDAVLSGSTDTSKPTQYKRRIWHSLTKNTNYMAAINLVGRIMRKANCSTDVATGNIEGFGSEHITAIKNGINGISIANIGETKVYDETSTEYKNLKLTDKNKRLLLLGMELHIITDAFAHRAYGIKPYLGGNSKDHWIKIGDVDEDNNSDADDINVYPIRYQAAGVVVKNVMNQCLKFDSAGSVVMKDTLVIGSKQIIYNNPFNKSSSSSPGAANRILLYKLYSYANANKQYDSTFSQYANTLAQYSYE